MNKLTATIATALIAVSMAAPAAARAESREVTQEYTMANGAFVGHGEAHWTLGAEYAVFRPERGERQVSITADDAVGEAVRVHVHVYRHGKLDAQLDFCGSTDEPIKIQPGSFIEVGTIMGVCDNNTPSIVTEGMITATFSK